MNRSAHTAAAGVWAGYAAALFAVQSFYGAAVGLFGTDSVGSVGLETFGPALSDPVLDGDATWIVMLAIIGLVKLVGVPLGLALVRPWGRALPRWLLLVPAYGAGALIVVYGLASLVQHFLMLAGPLDIPARLGETAAFWHVVLWDPWWVLGGVLFVTAARVFARGER